MADSCDCSGVHATTTSMSTGDYIMIIFVLVCLSLLALIFGAVWFCNRSSVKAEDKLQRKSLIMGPSTQKPVIPTWLENPPPSRKFCDHGVLIECRDYNLQFWYDNNLKKEQPMLAISWVRNIIIEKFGKDHTGNPLISVPKDTCVVCVPMKDFKCGESGYDFEPTSGMVPGSYHSYQMNGTERIQVTKYVEGGVEYVAGYCIYVNTPYDSANNYSKIHIENCYSGLEYKMMKVKQLEKHALSDGLTANEHVQIDILKTLKTIFCKTSKNPMLIGVKNGTWMHFEWNDTSGSFMTADCNDCHSEVTTTKSKMCN